MLRLKAFAKINLSLKILGKRPDGFHELESIMQSVSLHDLITLEPISSGIQLSTNNQQLPNDQHNLAYKAVEAFLRNKGTDQNLQLSGTRIFIDKKIPLAAGLAGGSADAAAVLFGLYGKIDDELLKIGATIGSDVPFCLVGGNCTVKGRGELLTKNKIPTKKYYILVTPNVEVSTKWAYETWDKMTNDKLCAKGASASGGQITNEGIKNDLEPVVAAKFPVINKLKDELLKLGCQFAQMSGSGPTVFGEVREAWEGEEILNKMKPRYAKSFFVETVDQGVELA